MEKRDQGGNRAREFTGFDFYQKRRYAKRKNRIGAFSKSRRIQQKQEHNGFLPIKRAVMKHDEFIGRVQHLAQLGSRGDAERATWATFQTLGERLEGGEAKDFASQLPPVLAAYALSGCPGIGERFSVQEFFRRVSDREGRDVQQAIQHARAVVEVLQKAISPGEIDDICAQLPSEYGQLFPSCQKFKCE
jgi:uncharacterized protein (DUF2267 family)